MEPSIAHNRPMADMFGLNGTPYVSLEAVKLAVASAQRRAGRVESSDDTLHMQPIARQAKQYLLQHVVREAVAGVLAARGADKASEMDLAMSACGYALNTPRYLGCKASMVRQVQQHMASLVREATKK